MKKSRLDQAFDTAVQLHQAGRFTEAEPLYRKVLSQQPNHDDALHLLGVMAAQLGQFEEAVKLISRAVVLRPATADYRVHLGNALSEKKEFPAAIAAYREALRLKPNSETSHDGIGSALREMGQLDEAVAEHHEALKIRPNFAMGHYNLGLTLQRKGLIEEAIASYRRAIALDANYAEAHWNLSLMLLLLGQFQEGWSEYEWRWRRPNFPRLWKPWPQPEWRGEDIGGKTLLIHAEQGYGDGIQFIRYAPMAAERGARVLFLCQAPLQRLMQNAPGVVEVVKPDALPPFDVQVPLLSLPRVFQTRLDSIPASVPYMQPEPKLAEAWRAKLAPSQGKLKVGLVWAGSPTNKNDKHRSVLLNQLAPLARAQNTVFYSLQKGPGSSQAATPPMGMNLIDLTEDLGDFADTAAMIANLDLIISVDTAVVHLAGALGKPAWVLIATEQDWRWLLHRDDTPWYPTHRLYRQKTPGEWTEIIEKVAESLSGYRV